MPGAGVLRAGCRVPGAAYLGAVSRVTGAGVPSWKLDRPHIMRTLTMRIHAYIENAYNENADNTKEPKTAPR